MNLEKITKEMKSTACQEVVKELGGILDRIQQDDIRYQQGSAEITACKHIIQSLALDWTFNNTRKSINKLTIGGTE